MHQSLAASKTSTPQSQVDSASHRVALPDQRASSVQAAHLQAAIAASPAQVAQRQAVTAIAGSPRQVAQRVVAPVQRQKTVIIDGVPTQVPDHYRSLDAGNRFPGRGVRLGDNPARRAESERLVREEVIGAAGNFPARPRDFGFPDNVREVAERRGHPAIVRPIPGQSTAPRLGQEPVVGKSTFANPLANSQASGPITRLERVPPGLAIAADGHDTGGTHSTGHRTIHPTEPMPFDDFNDRLSRSFAAKGNIGKIDNKKGRVVKPNPNFRP